MRCAACKSTWTARKPETEFTAGPGRDAGNAGSASPATIEGVAQHSRQESPARPGKADPGGRSPARLQKVLAASAILLFLAGLAGAVAGRDALVRHVPASGSLFGMAGLRVNNVGLVLADVTASVGEENGARVLILEGEIRSAAAQAVTVPRLAFHIEGKGRDPLYEWSMKAPIAELGAGESVRFATRLSSPPPGGERLVASFGEGQGD